MEQLNGQIMVAAMLIQLGVVTVEQIKALFVSDGHDDETLTQVMAEVDRRLARRS